MPANKDSRKIIGSPVHTKATFVTADDECQRRYGALWNSKMVSGEVEGVRSVQGKRKKQTYIDAVWAIGTRRVRKSLLLRNVNAGSCPVPQNADGSPQYVGREPEPTSPIEAAHTPTASTTAEQSVQECPATDSRTFRADERAEDNNASPVEEQGTSSDISRPEQTRGSPNNGTVPIQAQTHLNLDQADRCMEVNTTTAHGRTWKKEAVTSCLNEIPNVHHWSVRAWDGATITSQSRSFNANNESVAYYFYSMFPMEHLQRMVRYTSDTFLANGHTATSCGELLRLFGLVMLMTRYEFGNRREFWSSSVGSKYVKRPNFSQLMGRVRFDVLFSNVVFSLEPTGATHMTSVQQRWACISDFVEAFNDHRRRHVTPGQRLCVDESMIRWYGLGGEWIDIGIPQYDSIERKPEDGCEVQNLACGESGILLRLEVVSTAADEATRSYEGLVNHGTAVLKRLAEPWAGSNRVVCADSYFASVESAVELLRIGLKFIGVVKTATKGFPMKFLSELELEGRGQHVSLTSDVASLNKKLMALVWVDRNRRYFVASTSTTNRGIPYDRTRWRQTESGPQRVRVVVDQPKVLEDYYGTCAAVDKHNRCRQDDLQLERKVQVKHWYKRVNLGILGFCVVDAWKLYKGATGMQLKLTQSEFYEKLIDELIDNEYDQKQRRRVAVNLDFDDEESSPSSGRSAHLMPSKRRRTDKGSVTTHVVQSRCRGCSQYKSSHICSMCWEEKGIEVFLCHGKTGRFCFEGHYELKH